MLLRWDDSAIKLRVSSSSHRYQILWFTHRGHAQNNKFCSEYGAFRDLWLRFEERKTAS